MEHSESLKELAAALALAQSEIENAEKNANNPHFRSKYADLAEIINTTRPVLTKHGLAVVQLPGMADGLATVETILTHKSGEWLSGTAAAPLQKQDPQGVGSALTYLRRYSLAAVCNIAQEDDDGERAVGRRDEAPAVARSNGNGVKPWDKTMPFGKTKGKRLGELSEAEITNAIEWCNKTDAEKFADLVSDLNATMNRYATAGG